MSREFHTTCRSDTYVVESTPHISYADKPYLQVNNDSGHVHLALMHFGLPLHFKHYLIIEATLIFYKKGGTGWTGRDVTVKRLTESWDESVRWPGRPAHTDLHAATGSADGVNPVEVDVSDMMQDVVDGHPWHGVQMSVNGGDGSHKLHSSEGPFGLRPRLRITYTAKPDAVTNLSPDGVALYDPTPVVRWHAVYKPLHDQQARSQVQIARPTIGDTPDWDAGIEFDSGWQDNDKGAWDTGNPPSGPTFSGIPDGDKRFWRVRIRDERGNVSDWSKAAEMSYDSPGVVDIVSPATDGDGVQDTTPPIDWTFTPGGSGITQHAFRVETSVYRTTGWVLLDDTGWVFSTDTDFTIPHGVIRNVDMVPALLGREYKVKVLVLDGGTDAFGFHRNHHDVHTPHDSRTFVFRDGVRFDGVLEAPDGGAPAGATTMLTVPGIPAGADLTYASDWTADPNVPLVDLEVAPDEVYFAPGKNLLTANQSSVETSATGFIADVNCSVAQTTDQARDGVSSLEVTVTAGGNAAVRVADGADGVDVTVGEKYVASVFAATALAPRNVVVGVTFFDSSNAQIGASHEGSVDFDLAAPTWRRPSSAPFVAPVGAVRAGLRVRILDGAAGEVHYLDDLQIEQNDSGPTGWVVGESVVVGDDAVIVYNAIERPSNLRTSTRNPVVPEIQFIWERSSTPDQFGVLADGRFIAHLDGADVDDGDDTYSWSWSGMRPYVEHDITVRAKIDGVGWSGDSNSVRVVYRPRGIHLIASDIGLWVPIYGQEKVEETLSRDGATYYLVGRQDPVQISGKARGMYGSVSGQLITDAFGTSHEHLMDLFEVFGLHYNGPHLRLIFGHQAYHVTIGNLVHDQWPTAGGIVYNVSFDWWQTGDFQVPTRETR